MGVLALHYMTIHPSEKQLGVKEPASTLRQYDPWGPRIDAGQNPHPLVGMRSPVQRMANDRTAKRS